ncbi:MAG: NAD(P)H-dependent oxidoreductase, partial [Syntrophales bacterium]|nr:NAD(P)H-dependent oxidoreductase [Syntrophales bacterium]
FPHHHPGDPFDEVVQTLQVLDVEGADDIDARLDDLQDVLAAVMACDVLVMASPIYYGDVSSQMKAFIDRTFSFLKSDYTTNPDPSRLPPGKRLVFILTQGQPDEVQFSDVFPRYNYFFTWYGFADSELIRVCGVMQPADVEAHRNALETAAAVARKICGGEGGRRP